jgi:hypothetical protein
MGATISTRSTSFDSGVDLKTHDALFISGVGVNTEESVNKIVGYYVSPYDTKTSEYIYKPVTNISTIMSGESNTDDIPDVTTSTKFSHGYFLANIKRSNVFDKSTGIEEETITFITKNYEKNVEEVTLKVHTMLEPGSDYKSAATPDPTKCLDNQYIMKLNQTLDIQNKNTKTYSHMCQDAPVITWESKLILYKKPIGIVATLLVLLLIILLVFGGFVTGTATENNIKKQQNKLIPSSDSRSSPDPESQLI